MARIRIDTLDPSSPVLLEACVTLIVNAFADPERGELCCDGFGFHEIRNGCSEGEPK